MDKTKFDNAVARLRSVLDMIEAAATVGNGSVTARIVAAKSRAVRGFVVKSNASTETPTIWQSVASAVRKSKAVTAPMSEWWSHLTKGGHNG